MIEIEVDEARCVAGGQCVTAAPDVFDQRDDDGVVILLEANPSEQRLDAVKRAELVCPAAAIRVRVIP